MSVSIDKAITFASLFFDKTDDSLSPSAKVFYNEIAKLPNDIENYSTNLLYQFKVDLKLEKDQIYSFIEEIREYLNDFETKKRINTFKF